MTTYRLLGTVEARRGDAAVDVGGAKQRAVLAVLLLDAGRVVSFDRIVEAVWGERPPPNPAAGLQAYISKLRGLLRDENATTSPISRRAPGYVMDVDPGDIDVQQFARGAEAVRALIGLQRWAEAVETAEAALSLWRGPLVEEHADEEWVRLAARTYDEQRLVCQQDLVTALLGEGQVPQAVAHAGALHAAHPLDERACWLHALSLHRAGRTAEALDALRSFADVIDEELGLEPGPALRDLQGAILRQDQDVELWPRTGRDDLPAVVHPEVALTATGGRSGSPVPVPDPDPIVGRHRETAALTSVWAATRGGASSWVLVTGPPGIGKSRLAMEGVRSWVEGGGALARVGCPDDASVPAWWPLRQLLRQLGADPDTVLEPPVGVDVELVRFAVYDQVSAALRAVSAGRPTLIHLDDVQWADASTLRLLSHLVETDRTPSLAFLLTCREQVEGDDAQRLLDRLARRTDVLRLGLKALVDREVGELVRQVSGVDVSEEEVTDLARRTGGNPFFVSEYARLPPHERGSGEVPYAVRTVMERRIGSLPPDTLSLLRIAAVMGDPLDLEVLRHASGLDQDALADALDHAGDEHIVVADRATGTYAFSHALLRDELLAGLAPLRRQALHVRLATALQQRTDTDSLASRARHLLAAGSMADGGDAVSACVAIARDADRRWDSDGAVRWWEQALHVHDLRTAESPERRDDIVVGLVGALVRTGQGQRMLDVVDTSLLEAWRDGRTESVGVVASLLLRLTGSWPWVAYGSDPGPLITRLAGLEPRLREHRASHARVLAALAIGSCYDPDPDVPDSLSRRAIEIAETTGDNDVVADALLGRAMTFSGVGERAEESLQLLDRLVRMPHRLERFDEVIGHGVASMATLALGEVATTSLRVREGVGLAESLRLPVSLAQFRWCEGALELWRTDDVSGIEATYEQALALHQQTELTQSVTLILARLGLRWEQGRLHEGLGLEVDNPFLSPWIDAVVMAARRDPGAGVQLLHEVERPEPVVWTSHGRGTLLAHAAADLGLAAAVEPLRRQLLPVAGCLANFGQTSVVGPIALALARLDALAGDLASAHAHLDLATTLSQRAGGGNAVVRCRVVRQQLVVQEGGVPDADELSYLIAEAARRGLGEVERAARALR